MSLIGVLNGSVTATLTAEVQSRIVHATLHERPVNATHWSTRTLAEKLRLSATTVRRVWRSNGLKPHLSRSFKLSRDPRFEDKLLDVVSLYLNPPDALVLSCDEKEPDPGPIARSRACRWVTRGKAAIAGTSSSRASTGLA